MAGADTLTFTDADWDQEVLSSEKLVLVDFWAEWCGPCRQMSPTIDAIATEYKDRVRVGKINIDDFPHAAARYHVRGIPTVLLFKDGKVVGQQVGAVGKSELQKLLDQHVPQPA
ncbi:MAG TPA: thioredoxin [Bryobacteraceae bacterium]|nr:thioredoxin [Bryobacteraceae bacterium]